MENKLDPHVMAVGVIWPNTPICSGGHLSEGLARLTLSLTVRMKCSAELFLLVVCCLLWVLLFQAFSNGLQAVWLGG